MVTVAWINQGGEGGLFSASDQKIKGGETRAVFLADLDADGDLDALIAEKRQVSIWWNTGQGIFTRASQRFHYSQRHALIIGDFNGDATLDIFAGAYAETYTVWYNQGDGRFLVKEPR